MEKAFLPQELSEVRTVQVEDGVKRIDGRAIVFDSRSRPMRTIKSISMKIKSFCEVIDSRSLDNADFSNAISCWNHNRDMILGSVANGTATFEIDSKGMPYSTFPIDTQTNRDLVFAPIERRDVRGSSFVFYCAPGDDEWVLDPDGTVIRYIKKIETVYEWGPVTMPAYLDTTTDVVSRSFDEFINSIHNEEKSYRSQYAKIRLALRK